MASSTLYAVQTLVVVVVRKAPCAFDTVSSVMGRGRVNFGDEGG